MSHQEQIPTISDMKYIEMGHALPYFNRNFFLEKNKIYEFAKEHEYTGVYRSAYLYDVNSKENIKDAFLFSSFYMDFDNEDNPELAKEDLLYVIWKMSLKTTYNLPIEAFRIYFSGKKGFHLIIPHQYLGILPNKKLDILFKWIATGFQQEVVNETIDLVVYERRRLWRLENTKHTSTGLYKIPIEYKELTTLSMEEIQALAKSPRVIEYPEPKLIPAARKEYLREAKEMYDYNKNLEEKYKNYKPSKAFDPDNIPDYIQKLIDEGPVDGFRNETVAALTSFYFQLGHSEEEVLGLLLEWNNGSLPNREVKTTVQSVYRNKLVYSKKRFRALAEKDMSIMSAPVLQMKAKPVWKKG